MTVTNAPTTLSVMVIMLVRMVPVSVHQAGQVTIAHSTVVNAITSVVETVPVLLRMTAQPATRKATRWKMVMAYVSVNPCGLARPASYTMDHVTPFA